MNPLGFWGAHPTNTCSGWWWWHFRHGDHFPRSFLGIQNFGAWRRQFALSIRFPPQRPDVILRTKRPHPWYIKQVHSPETIGVSNRWSLGLRKKWVKLISTNISGKMVFQVFATILSRVFLRNAFHGRTMGALALTWKETKIRERNLGVIGILCGSPSRPLNKSRWWFQILFIFTPTWGNDPIWRAYLSDGLVQPPARNGLSEKTIILIGIYFIINFRELDRDHWITPRLLWWNLMQVHGHFWRISLIKIVS